MIGGKILSASDKAVFDALSQKNVTNLELRELFLSRGILVSKDTSRKQLALHFSRLPHDYFDYQKLASIFSSPNQREKMTSTRVKTEIPMSTFESSAHELKADLEKSGAAIRVFSAKGSRLDIEVKYQKLNFNKSEFRQVVNRVATISIQKDGEEFTIHSPHNDDAREWIQKLIRIVSEKSGENLSLDDIRLPPGFVAKEKSDFFNRLIKSMPGYRVHDVSDVYIANPRIEAEEDDNDTIVEVHITKASLKGQGVLLSDELKTLEKKGFYISKMIWASRTIETDSDLYEFEAQFSSPEDCSGFTYLPRGFYKHQDSGSFGTSRNNFTTNEEQRLGRLIEKTARETLYAMIGEQNAQIEVAMP